MTTEDIDALPPSDRKMATVAIKRCLRVQRQGKIWRVYGYGVDIRALRLSYISPGDLLPADMDRRRRWN